MNENSYPGKVIVTGASSGIGLAISRRLMREGVHVVGVARNFDQQVMDCWSETVQIDLAKLDDLPKHLDTLKKRHSDVDAVIACAGQGLFGNLEELSYQQVRGLLDLNLTSQIYLAKAFIQILKTRGRGDIVFIGSEAAIRPGRKGTAYCASKFGLKGFAQALRQEAGNKGVRVSLVNPGMVDTAFYDNLNFRPGIQAGQYLDAEAVAESVQMILQASPATVFDEINLTPQSHVIAFKDRDAD